MGGPDRPGPTAPPPTPADSPDVVVRVHESYVNNALAARLGGKTMTGNDFRKEAIFLLGPFGRNLEFHPEVARLMITFDEERPLTVAFADHRVTITLRASAVRSDQIRYPGLHVVLRYRLSPTTEGARATREGDVEVMPPPGKKIDIREQILAALVRQRLGETFQAELVLDRPRIPRRLQSAGPLLTTQADTADGWVILAWRMKGKGP
jgi:hypothetical protein